MADKIEFTVVKPNVYILGNSLYFSLHFEDVLPVSRSIDEVVRRNVGELKVQESVLESLRTGKAPITKSRVPLRKQLDLIVDLRRTHSEDSAMIFHTTDVARYFGLGYSIASSTLDDFMDVENWLKLQNILVTPDKYFNEMEQEYSLLKVDREKTLTAMKASHKTLDPKIPNHAVGYDLIPPQEGPFFVGHVRFRTLKTKDTLPIDTTRDQLVERLKEVNGPCLSLDAPSLLRQSSNLYVNAPELIQTYGDILTAPTTWQKRLFRLDP